jgi:anti-sigma factor ChrR (cupin superfamily)
MHTGLRIDADGAQVAWRPTSTEGVEWCLLESEGAGEGPAAGATVLIRMAPGCGYPAHRHLDTEEVLVLAGGYRDEQGDHLAGAYLRYPANSEHTPVAIGDTPCLLYATARGGIEVLGEQGASG